MFIALAGGVGGAKLARGLAAVLPPEELTIVVNTGDDFTHLGFAISPDLDTVMYNLAGINNEEVGWGIQGDTGFFMEKVRERGGETWFYLGDKDVEIQEERILRLKRGETLSAVMKALSSKFNVKHRILPMSNNPVSTLIHTVEGVLPFQTYFVKKRAEPAVLNIEYQDALEAEPNPELLEALDNPRLKGIIICPSNPLLSIGPILSLPGLKERLRRRSVPILAVSPLIGGLAVKGPVVKIMKELEIDPSVLGIARFYEGFIDRIVIDHADSQHVRKLTKKAIQTHVTNILMKNRVDSKKLAKQIIGWLR